MKLDIRMPLGLLFLVFGLLLTIFGLVSNKSLYVRSLGININLWWGMVMLVFGMVMVMLGRREERRQSDLEQSAAQRTVGSAAGEE